MLLLESRGTRLKQPLDTNAVYTPGRRERRLRFARWIYPWTRAFPPSSKRHAGESLRSQLEMVDNDIGMTVFGIVGFAAGYYLCWYTLHLTPAHQAWYMLATFLTVLVIGGFFLVRLWRQFVRLHKGLRAELKVGDNLDLLQHRGARVIHDIQCIGKKARYNIDHCVIHPSGIWVIETKYVSPGRHGILDVSEEGLRCGPKKLGDGALRQARRNAFEIRDVIYKATARKVWIHPAVLVEGFTIRGESEFCRVDNVQGFLAYIRSLPSHLSPQEIKSISEALLAYSLKNSD